MLQLLSFAREYGGVLDTSRSYVGVFFWTVVAPFIILLSLVFLRGTGLLRFIEIVFSPVVWIVAWSLGVLCATV